MADTDTTIDLGGDDDSTFETDAVHANRDIQQGLGVGARELAAQREARGAVLDSGAPGDGVDGDDDEEDA